MICAAFAAFLAHAAAEGGKDKRFALPHAVIRNQVIVINSGVIVAVELHQFPNAAFEDGKAGIPRRRIPQGRFRNFDYMLACLFHFMIHFFHLLVFSVLTSTNIESSNVKS